MLADSSLKDKIVLVSGGSRGIGRAIVETFAAEGSKVVFFFLTDRAAADIVVERANGADVVAQQLDIRSSEACAAAVESLIERHGRVDVLINNSGVIRDHLLPMLEDVDILDVLATNVNGLFNLTRAVLPSMISARSGKIINISSVAAEKGGRGQTNYAASKGAVNSFTRALAVEVAPRGITVNAVAPGVIKTEMSEGVLERGGDEVLKRILLRRLGTPEDVANAVVFLASRYADYITGEVLHVDGGFKME